jgi:arginyl-tRNA synthetase
MSLEDQLREKFAQAIKEMIKPPVLVGPKWLRHYRKGKPADFQYIGVSKVAKATGKDIDRVASMLLKRVDLGSMGLKVELAADGTINIWKQKPAKKADSVGEGKAQSDAGSSSPEG